MRTNEMADVVKSDWFGRDVTVLLENGKSMTGELSETSSNYIVLTTQSGDEVQIMVHAIVLIKSAGASSA
ncbi:MAG: hypothetical protein ACLFWL_04600 [Candidatus Brocadiia bacterium]|nr:hypothetical protein [Planctomycetota bacterium]